jgi:hypothetical protein
MRKAFAPTVKERDSSDEGGEGLFTNFRNAVIWEVRAVFRYIAKMEIPATYQSEHPA